MGWTYSHRPKGFSDLDWFVSQGVLAWSGEHAGAYRVVDAATIDQRVFHAVLETNAAREPRLAPDEAGKVRLALVILLKSTPKEERYNFGYKEMDEFMGPSEAICPDAILNQLSPFEPAALAGALARRERALAAGRDRWADYSPILSAQDWRERSRAYNALAKAVRTPGTQFRLRSPRAFPMASAPSTSSPPNPTGAGRPSCARTVLGSASRTRRSTP